MLTSDPQPDHLLLACRDGSLPRTDWTHEAHLAVARASCSTRPAIPTSRWASCAA
ncbi:MAG: hypothetical protein R2690_05470 [Acidimicrobiales bacterium]